jgi:sec-independent protein translocase protein TatB
MIDFGFDKILLIGTVALVVLGPEKLPRTARTIGHLIGKAQRYVADVKSEVNRSIELEELKKMKSQFETAARDVEQSVQDGVRSATDGLNQGWGGLDGSAATDGDDTAAALAGYEPAPEPTPDYKHPGKKWRLKRSAVPQWFKQRAGVRRHAQSGAARVARFRPPGGFPR